MHEFHLDTTLGRGEAASPVPEGVFRLLLVGDFSGAGDDAAPSASTLAARAPCRVDLDTAESVLRAWAPQVRLRGIAGQPPETLRLDGFEALTPDGLVTRLATVAAVRRALDQPPPAPPRGGAVRGGGVLDAILDEASPPDPMTAMHEAGGDLSAFIDAALRGHTVTAAQRDAADRTTAREAATDAVLRAVLRDPAFRAVESLWLSVQLMTRRLEQVRGVEVWLLDLAPSALPVALPPGGDPLASPLAAMLRQSGGAWSVIGAAFEVTGSVENIEQVAQLAALGSALGAPWVLGGAPALTGFDALVDAADADSADWPEGPEAWGAFRRTALARWVAVVPNGVLARAPYGRDGEQVDRPFEEWEGGGRHGLNAWAPPSYGALMALGLSYDAATSRVQPAGAYAIDGLPFVMAAGVPVPVGQVLLSERAYSAFTARGLTPLETHKSAGVVRVRGLYACAVPPQPVAGTIWGTT